MEQEFSGILFLEILSIPPEVVQTVREIETTEKFRRFHSAIPTRHQLIRH